MATIRKEIRTRARPDAAWDAMRDIGALHERLVVGFVVDTRLDGDARIVTFANGMQVRELIVGIDEKARRLAYSVGRRFVHASQCIGRDRSRRRRQPRDLDRRPAARQRCG